MQNKFTEIILPRWYDFINPEAFLEIEGKNIQFNIKHFSFGKVFKSDHVWQV